MMLDKPLALCRRAVRYVLRGLASFVLAIRDEMGEAELDTHGFYLCKSCGYAHPKGSGCSITRAPGE